MTALALEGFGSDCRVVDPSCGGGVFLLSAADLLVERGADPKTVVSAQLAGADVDPLAVEVTRAALGLWASRRGVDEVDEIDGIEVSGVVVADGLAAGWCETGPDVVVGNPPFLTPLRVATLTSRPTAAGRPYADLAGEFLLAALELVRDGGRVALVLPESILAARDAGPVREAVLDRAAIEGLWVAGEPVFGAAVRVCAPVLRRGGVQPSAVRRWRGAAVRAGGSQRVDPRRLVTWAPLRPTSAPAVRLSPRTGVLGDMAAATAGFRDEFYGLAGAAAERDGVHDDRPKLVTSGLIDVGRLLWGERPTRLRRQGFTAPVLDTGRLDARLKGWVEARLRPKVLVATQTRVVEAVADPSGELVPVTPVIAVTPHDADDVWRVAAVLTAPPVSAWALRHFGGTALASDAVKLSGRQVRSIPRPVDDRAWHEGSVALAGGDVAGCAVAMNEAYRAPPGVLTWWRSRLPRQ